LKQREFAYKRYKFGRILYAFQKQQPNLPLTEMAWCLRAKARIGKLLPFLISYWHSSTASASDSSSIRRNYESKIQRIKFPDWVH
jgi:hypothetical protein